MQKSNFSWREKWKGNFSLFREKWKGNFSSFRERCGKVRKVFFEIFEKSGKVRKVFLSVTKKSVRKVTFPTGNVRKVKVNFSSDPWFRETKIQNRSPVNCSPESCLYVQKVSKQFDNPVKSKIDNGFSSFRHFAFFETAVVLP